MAELSALLSECDSLRDRLDLMASSYNTIDTQLRTRRSSISTTTSNNNSFVLSPSVHNHTMKAMLQQTRDDYNRLVQTLRSSKQTIESKQQRLQTLYKQLNDIEHEYEVILTTANLPAMEEVLKDDQYEYKDECQRRRVREKHFNFYQRFSFGFFQLTIQDIEPKQNRLQTITSEANDLNDLQLANNAKRLITQFDHLRRDLSVRFLPEFHQNLLLFFDIRLIAMKVNVVFKCFKNSPPIVPSSNKPFKLFKLNFHRSPIPTVITACSKIN